jgi:hypothetical protein
MPGSSASGRGAVRVAVPREDRAIGVCDISSNNVRGAPLRFTCPRPVKRKVLYSSTYNFQIQVSQGFDGAPGSQVTS